MTDITASPAYRFGRLLQIFNDALPNGLHPSLVNNSLALPASHYGTLAQIVGPYLDDAARKAINEIAGDGLNLPRVLPPVRQLEVWQGYYHQASLMDGPEHRALDMETADYTAQLSESAEPLEDRHDIFG